MLPALLQWMWAELAPVWSPGAWSHVVQLSAEYTDITVLSALLGALALLHALRWCMSTALWAVRVAILLLVLVRVAQLVGTDKTGALEAGGQTIVAVAEALRRAAGVRGDGAVPDGAAPAAA